MTFGGLHANVAFPVALSWLNGQVNWSGNVVAAVRDELKSKLKLTDDEVAQSR